MRENLFEMKMFLVATLLLIGGLSLVYYTEKNDRILKSKAIKEKSCLTLNRKDVEEEGGFGRGALTFRYLKFEYRNEGKTYYCKYEASPEEFVRSEVGKSFIIEFEVVGIECEVTDFSGECM